MNHRSGEKDGPHHVIGRALHRRVPILQALLGPSLVIFVTLSLARPARAFHDGGVPDCDNCHTMHNSQDGMPVNPDDPAGSQWLLHYESPTDLCLSCHAMGNGDVLGHDPLNPPPEKGAGNFVYLLEDDINDATQGQQWPIPGYRAGHSVATVAWGIPADPENRTAPGGTYSSDQLTCTSCHDPHGNQNFRMLHGVGPVDYGAFNFSYPAPEGEGIALNDREGRTNHTAYRGGWSEWCANCHGFQPHRDLMSFEHPLDEGIGSEIADNYNSYDGPDSPNGGQYTDAYIPELPIEDSDKNVWSTSGATSVSRITCMTCHRAHATSAPRALRWDPNVAWLSSDGVASGSYPIPDPYSHPEQRALCIKCHYDEASNHGVGRPCMSCHRTRASSLVVEP